MGSLSSEDLLPDRAYSNSLKTSLAAGLQASSPTLGAVSADQIEIENMDLSTARRLRPEARQLQSFVLDVSYKVRISSAMVAAVKGELVANRQAFAAAME